MPNDETTKSELSLRDNLMLNYICPDCGSKVQKIRSRLLCGRCGFWIVLWESRQNA